MRRPLIYLAGLRAIPKDLYEAAQVDGAGPSQTFWRITLPLLTPVTLSAVILLQSYLDSAAARAGDER